MGSNDEMIARHTHTFRMLSVFRTVAVFPARSSVSHGWTKWVTAR